MKIVPRIIILLAILVPLADCFAAPTDPPPPTPPPPPGTPVDGGLLVLVIISILFGLYKIYQAQSYKKTSL